MSKIIKITILFDDHKQTLQGADAERWFSAVAANLKTFPLEIIAAPWKKRKTKKFIAEIQIEALKQVGEKIMAKRLSSDELMKDDELHWVLYLVDQQIKEIEKR